MATYEYTGNAAFMELYEALRNSGLLPASAAEVAAQVYERCGDYGHIPASQR